MISADGKANGISLIQGPSVKANRAQPEVSGVPNGHNAVYESIEDSSMKNHAA
jgi:hypothetical protein